MLSVAMMCRAQSAELAAAVKSPATLAKYVESRSDTDWAALWKALGVPDPRWFSAPCMKSGEPKKCPTRVITASNPDQSILIIGEDELRATNLCIRYLGSAAKGWKYAGMQIVGTRDAPVEYEIVRIWGKPILKITSDTTQAGVGLSQQVVDWFDLTQSRFEPVFSFSPDTNLWQFAVDVSYEIKVQTTTSQNAGREHIDVSMKVRPFGPDFDLGTRNFTGVYERSGTEKKFTLRRATIPNREFAALRNAIEEPLTDQIFRYALPGLRKVAAGNDADAREWLTSVLSGRADSPEKRELLAALAGH